MKQRYNIIKSRKRNVRIAVAIWSILSLLPAQAQTPQNNSAPNRIVIVEQEYNPEIQDARKINALPPIEEPAVVRKQAEYDTSASPAQSFSDEAMPIYAAQENREKNTRGYARLGYGNYGNLDVKGSYLFNLTEKDKLHLYLSTDGMEGNVTLLQSEEKWKKRYYQTRAGIDYEYRFERVSMELGGHTGMSDFNLLPSSPTQKQRFTMGDIHLGINSIDKTLPLQFQAETNLLFYTRKYDALESPDTNKERIVRTKANVTGAISDEQTIGIASEMNNIFYRNKSFSDYTALDLKPYYEQNGENWKLHAGVNISLAFGYGDKLRLSPDVTAQYLVLNNCILYAKATGGKQLNDFRQLETASPYGELSNNRMNEDIYEQVNARLGFRASPAAGFWFHLYGGYQNIKDDLYHYWGSMSDDASGPTVHFDQTHTTDLYTGAQFNYSYKSMVNIMAKGTYYSREADNEAALYFRPEYSFYALADVRPIPELALKLEYQYVTREKVVEERFAPINNLDLGVDYRFYKGLAAYTRVNNILDKHFQYYHLYPTQGINFTAGLSYRF